MDRWQEIENIYHAARERNAEERREFLDEVCSNHNALRIEVESLLSCEAEAEEFFQSASRPAGASAEAKTMLSRLRSWIRRKATFTKNARRNGPA